MCYVIDFIKRLTTLHRFCHLIFCVNAVVFRLVHYVVFVIVEQITMLAQ